MFAFFKRKKKAQLEDVACAIAFANRSGKYYYKKSEEEVVLLPNPAFAVTGVRDPLLETDIRDHPDDYLPIPVLTMADEMRLMYNYAKQQKDTVLGEELVQLLGRPGAMRLFRSRIRSSGLQEDWDRYRGDNCMEAALEWAGRNGLKGVRPSNRKRGY